VNKSPNELESKLRTGGIALGCVLLALVLVDFIALKGEPVASTRVSLRKDSDPETLTISRAGEEHTVEISTRKRTGGENEGRKIRYRLVAPSGQIAAEDSELVSHKKRYFDFVPPENGDYQLFVEEKKLLGTGNGTAWVDVTVDDRRILSRLLRF